MYRTVSVQRTVHYEARFNTQASLTECMMGRASYPIDEATVE